MKRRRRRPYDPIKAAKIVMMAESNAVTSRKPKKLPAIVNHDQLLRTSAAAASKANPMIQCMQELKNIRQANVEKVLKKVGKVMDHWTNLVILIFFK